MLVVVDTHEYALMATKGHTRSITNDIEYRAKQFFSPNNIMIQSHPTSKSKTNTLDKLSI